MREEYRIQESGDRSQKTGNQGKRDFGDCPRTKFKKQNWCGICAHSELEKFWRESEAIQREKNKKKERKQNMLALIHAFSLKT